MRETKGHLSLEERRKIWKYARLGYGIRRIGRELGRDPSVVSRELKRNSNLGADWIERTQAAQALAEQRRTRANESRTRLKSEEVQRYVEEKLKLKWSPEIISLRIGKDLVGAEISHEAIYQWVRERRPELMKYLKICGKSRRRRRGKKQHRPKGAAAPKTSIEERPEEINQRLTVGHWEGDLIVSKKSKYVVLHLKERKTRFSKLRRLSNAKAVTIKQAVIEILGFYPPDLVYTVTFDNGSENALHQEIADSLDVAVYFCHAYSSWEKGAVEHGNRRVREDLPKGTDFALVTEAELQAVEDRINHTPMKCLTALTPAEAFNAALFACCH